MDLINLQNSDPYSMADITEAALAPSTQDETELKRSGGYSASATRSYTSSYKPSYSYTTYSKPSYSSYTKVYVAPSYSGHYAPRYTSAYTFAPAYYSYQYGQVYHGTTPPFHDYHAMHHPEIFPTHHNGVQDSTTYLAQTDFAVAPSESSSALVGFAGVALFSLGSIALLKKWKNSRQDAKEDQYQRI